MFNYFSQFPGGWSYAQYGPSMLGYPMSIVKCKENKMIKVGDVVTLKDASWATTVKAGEIVTWWAPGDEHWDSMQYTVVAIDCSLPMRKNTNDIIIQSMECGEIIFIARRMLRHATRKIEIDGKTIELSEKSFQNLKEQLCPTS